MDIAELIKKQGNQIRNLTIEEHNELVKQIRSGNERAARFFMDHYTQFSYSVLRHFDNLTNEEKEEIVQDSLIKLIYKNYTSRSNPKGLVRRTVINLALTQLQRNSKMPGRANGHDISEHYQVLPAWYVENFEKNVLFNDYNSKISNYIGNKAPASLKIFNLYYMEGLTHMEIANVLDISEGTSKSQLFRFMEKYRKHYHKIA